MFLANKGVCLQKLYDKILVETGKLSDNIKVVEKGPMSGVGRMFKIPYISGLCVNISQ